MTDMHFEDSSSTLNILVALIVIAIIAILGVYAFSSLRTAGPAQPNLSTPSGTTTTK